MVAVITRRLLDGCTYLVEASKWLLLCPETFRMVAVTDR